MGATNMGTQVLSFDFLQSGSAKSFNKLLLDLITPGLYSGLLVSIQGGKPQVAPGVAFLKSNNVSWSDKVGVRAEFQTDYLVADWTAGTPFVVLRLNWADVEANYVDIIAVATPDPTDLVLAYVPNTSTVDYAHATYPRSIVIRYADTIPLNQGISSAPTGGTGTNLSGANTIVNALNEIFARLRDLSGVASSGVVIRHLDRGTGAGKINARSFQIDSTFDFGGTDNDVIVGDSILGAMTKFYNALKDLNGVTDDSVGTRLINWGLAGDQVNGAQMPANVATAFGSGGGVVTPDTSDSVQSVFQKIIGALADLSGAGNSSLKKRHIDFSDTKGKDFTIGTAITQALAGLGSVSILIGDALDTAFTKVLAGCASIASALNSLTSTVGSLSTTVSGHTTAIGLLDALPKGAMITFDGSSWDDDVTIPGWFACTSGNFKHGCSDLVGYFVRGDSPSIAGNSESSKKVLVGNATLAKGNIPVHVHDMTHLHINVGVGDHRHKVDNVDDASGNGANTERWTTYEGAHNHTMGIPRNLANTADATDTGNGLADGLKASPDPVQLTKQYAVIWIRKCYFPGETRNP